MGRAGRRCGFGQVEGYACAHRPPSAADGAPAHDLTANGVYPADVYAHPDWYADGRSEDATAAAVVRRVRGRPDATVLIFRAVPCAVRRINRGDWVTTVRKYAVDHGRAVGSFDEKDMCVLYARVPARCIHTDGNSLFEWGYNCDQQPVSRVTYRPKRGRRG